MNVRYKPGLSAVLLAVAAVVAVATAAVAGTSPPVPQAGVTHYGTTPVCGTNWVPVDLGSGNYLTVYNGNAPGGYTCIKVPYPGHIEWKITSVRDPVSEWLYPNVSAGWEWGRYTCNGAPSARVSTSKCMRFPVRAGSMGRTYASMRMGNFPQTGRYNVAWDIWFSRTARTPVYQNDAAEIMIWTINRGITFLHQQLAWIDGREWWVEHWTTRHNGVSWRLTAFLLVHQATSVTALYLNPFVSWAAARGRVSLGNYLTAIDFGSEISSGDPQESFTYYSLTGVR